MNSEVVRESKSAVWLLRERGGEARKRLRIALYSPGMIGLGHIRRNLAIAQALTETSLNPVILLIAESREANAFVIPKGVDCLTLPALRKEPGGEHSARYLDLAIDDLVRIRSRIIQAAIQGFNPDVFIVDHLARGAFHELDLTLQSLKKMDHTRCVLGLRDIIGDSNTVQNDWKESATIEVIRNSYEAIWVYGDPRVCNLMKEYDLPQDLAEKISYAGYLDKSARLHKAIEENHDPYHSLHLPRGRLALCLVGGGQDGARLAEAFARARLPRNTNGIIVTGPYMSEEDQNRIARFLSQQPRMRMLQFICEPILLLNRADFVIAMGGYNTVCEILSFGKKSLIVPRLKCAPEQGIRAERLNKLGLLEYLPCEDLTPKLLSRWLCSDSLQSVSIRNSIDLNGLNRLTSLMMELVASRISFTSS